METVRIAARNRRSRLSPYRFGGSSRFQLQLFKGIRAGTQCKALPGTA